MLYSNSDVQPQSLPLQAYRQAPQPNHGINSLYSVSEGSTTTNQSSSNENLVISTKPKVESLAFGYQFAEVENAISNFTKHQPFNHHYAPNVNVNRNHHHHNNNINSNNNNRYNNYNNSNNNNNNNGGRFHQKQQQAQFSMNAQLKQQQQQQQQHFVNNNVQQMNRYKQMNNGNIHQQKQQQYQQYQPQHYQQQGLALNTSNMMNNSFQSVQQPQFSHSDLMNPISNSSPTFGSSVRSGSNGFISSLDQLNSPASSTFGLNNSDFLNTPLTNVSSSNGESVDKNLSLDDSNAYLGDIWGNNSKSGLRNSTSVWA